MPVRHGPLGGAVSHGRGDPDASGIETDLAVAAADCVVSTGYAAVWLRAQERAVAAATNDPDLPAYSTIVGAALPRANEVVAGR